MENDWNFGKDGGEKERKKECEYKKAPYEERKKKERKKESIWKERPSKERKKERKKERSRNEIWKWKEGP